MIGTGGEREINRQSTEDLSKSQKTSILDPDRLEDYYVILGKSFSESLLDNQIDRHTKAEKDFMYSGNKLSQ